MRHIVAILLLVFTFTASLPLQSGAADGARLQYIPIAQAAISQAAQPTPTPSPTPPPPAAYSLEFVATARLPYACLGGVTPTVAQDATGTWFISCFRIEAGDQNGAYVVVWRDGWTAALPLDRATPAGDEASRDVRASDCRGAIGLVHPDVQDTTGAYYFSFDCSGNSRAPRLVVHRIKGFVP